MTVDARFQVTDPLCGLVEACGRKMWALDRAVAHERLSPCDGVTVFDVMARRGQPQEWKANGKVVAFRPYPWDEGSETKR